MSDTNPLMWRIVYYGLLGGIGLASLSTPYAEAITARAIPLIALLPLAFFAARFLGWLWRLWPESPLPPIRAAWRAPVSSAVDRMCLFVSSTLFAIWLPPIKASFPKAHGFWADVYLAHADRLLLGTDAWKLTSFLDPITPLIDYLYGLWPLTITAASMGIALFAREPLLRRFFLGLALAWTLLGIWLASILASAGPIFGPELGFGFADLRQAMAVARYSLPAHEYLWTAYSSGSLKLGAGISAAPSMHCALTFLLVYCSYRSRWFVPALCYAAFIWIGSVHLGWHYFCDGLLSLAGVSLIWVVVSAPFWARMMLPKAPFRRVDKGPIARARMGSAPDSFSSQ